MPPSFFPTAFQPRDSLEPSTAQNHSPANVILPSAGGNGEGASLYGGVKATAVVEIRSPGDESLEKLPFYAELGVPEVWIVDRDTKAPQIYVLAGGTYEDQAADADGWLTSAATGVWLRVEAGNKLAIRLGNDPSTLRLLPE